jgi:hypothetical protein
MSVSYLTEEDKKQYIISVMVSALMKKLTLTAAEAERLIAASSLQQMLDAGFADYLLESDEDYWLEQIVALHGKQPVFDK